MSKTSTALVLFAIAGCTREAPPAPIEQPIAQPTIEQPTPVVVDDVRTVDLDAPWRTAVPTGPARQPSSWSMVVRHERETLGNKDGEELAEASRYLLRPKSAVFHRELGGDLANIDIEIEPPLTTPAGTRMRLTSGRTIFVVVAAEGPWYALEGVADVKPPVVNGEAKTLATGEALHFALPDQLLDASELPVTATKAQIHAGLRKVGAGAEWFTCTDDFCPSTSMGTGRLTSPSSRRRRAPSFRRSERSPSRSPMAAES